MILLLVIIAGMALFMFDGYKKGMVKIILSLVATLVTLLLAQMLTPPVTAIVKSTGAYTNVQNNLREKLEENNVFASGEEKKIIDKLDLPDQLKEYIKKCNTEKMYKKLGVDKFEDYVIKMVSDITVRTVVFTVLFIIIFIAVKIAISVLNIIAKLPIIKQFNQTGGLIIGAAQGLIMVWIFFIAISLFSNTEFATTVYEQINQNAIVSFLYDNNLILKTLLSVLK